MADRLSMDQDHDGAEVFQTVANGRSVPLPVYVLTDDQMRELQNRKLPATSSTFQNPSLNINVTATEAVGGYALPLAQGQSACRPSASITQPMVFVAENAPPVLPQSCHGSGAHCNKDTAETESKKTSNTTLSLIDMEEIEELGTFSCGVLKEEDSIDRFTMLDPKGECIECGAPLVSCQCVLTDEFGAGFKNEHSSVSATGIPAPASMEPAKSSVSRPTRLREPDEDEEDEDYEIEDDASSIQLDSTEVTHDSGSAARRLRQPSSQAKRRRGNSGEHTHSHSSASTGGSGSKKASTGGSGRPPDDVRWANTFAMLQTYYEQNGHSNVPYRYHDIHLGRWVKNQRAMKKAGNLTPQRVQQLESVEFSWNARRIRKPKSTSRSSSDTNATPDFQAKPDVEVWSHTSTMNISASSSHDPSLAVN